MSLEHKASSTSPESGLINSDDATGVVEAIVSVTGVVDEDRDVIEPGAYTKTLTKRRPKGIFAHDWGRWVARTEHIEELQPGDDRLPKQTKDGRPWPPNAGGLYVRTRFNLATREGKDAYENVKFFSETGEGDWSIGFRVPPGAASRDKKTGYRHIKELDLYEYSPVLFGAAGTYSGTLSVKALGQPPEADGAPDGEDEPNSGERSTTEGERPEAPAEQSTIEGERTGTITESGSDPEPTADPPQDDPAPDEDEGDEEAVLHRQGAAVLHILDEDPPADLPDTDDEEDTGEEQQEPETLAAETGDNEGEEGEAKRAFAPGKRRQLAKEGDALADGSYPIKTVGDLKNAIKAFGRAKPEDRAKVKAHIVRRARALGRTDLLPDGWGNSKKDGENGVETKAGVPGVADTASDVQAAARLKRWYVHGDGAARIRWGQPGDFMRCVRLAEKHMDPKKSRGFCANRHKDALGVWPGQEGQGRKDVYDPALESGPDGGGSSAEPDRVHPYLPGTVEDLRDRLANAASKTLGDGRIVQVVGTWPDRVVVTAYDHQVGGGAESYEFPYTTKDDGAVHLGDAEPVQLTTFDALTDREGEEEPLSPYPGMVEQVADDLKALLAGGALEDKAGRVLSTANAKRLKTAVEQVVAVLRAAGLDISLGPDQDEAPQTRPELVADTTAPSARDVKTLDVDPTLQARAWRIIADAHART